MKNKYLFVCLIILSIIIIYIVLNKNSAIIRKPKNIIVISIDCLNRSAIKPYNSNAPDLKSLALLSKRSAVFDRVYTSSSWTLPAHGSLFTGCYPDRHGATKINHKISDSIPVLSKELHKAGYYTAGFTDGGFVSFKYGFNRGFDRYDEWKSSNNPIKTDEIPRNGKHNEVSGTTLFDRGIKFINSWKGGKKGFFLFLHTYVVHDYFKLHPWAVKRTPPYPDKNMNFYLKCTLGVAKGSKQEWKRLSDLYRAELYRMDQGISQLLTVLKNNGQLKNTLIIFLSDHGEGFDPARSRIGHGGRLHEDLIRIPLFISGPGIKPKRYNKQISIVDIMPTILDLCKIPVPAKLDGKSFSNVFNNKEKNSNHPIYAMEHEYIWKNGRRFRKANPGNFRLSIAVIHKENWYIRDLKQEELFKMNNDPLQERNLATDSKSKKRMLHFVKKRRRYKPIIQKTKKEKKLRQRLKSFGYL